MRKYLMLGALAALLNTPAALACPLAYVSNIVSDDISVVDLATRAVVDTIPVSGGPAALALRGDKLYVTQFYEDQVSVVDLRLRRATVRHSVGRGPIALALTPDGAALYVSNYGDHTLSVLRLPGLAPLGTIQGVGRNPAGVAMNPSRGVAYATSQAGWNLHEIDLPTRAIRRSLIELTVGPRGMAVSRDGAKVYLASLSGRFLQIDAATLNVDADIASGSGALRPVLSPSGTYAYVVNYSASTVAFMHLPSMTRETALSLRDGTTLTFPSDIAITPDGATLVVPRQGKDDLVLIDAQQAAISGAVAVGRAPYNVVISPQCP